MGNSDSKVPMPSSAKVSVMRNRGVVGRRRSSLINRKEQLRAQSFLRREEEADRVAGLGDLLDKDREQCNCNDIPKDPEATIERLQANIRILSEKCGALESQNILVSVQQLDWLVWAISYSMSGLALYAYWQCLSFGIPRIPWPMIIKELSLDANDVPQIAHTLWMYAQPYALPTLKTMLWTIPYLYNKVTHGSFHRRMQVFSVAFIVIGRIRLCRWREQVFLQPDSENNQIPPFGEACTNDGIWEANYEISARFLYLSVKRLRGLWTKSAQYLSSRADFMPLGYIRELSKLQDQAPVTPWHHIKHLLPSKLKKDLIKIDTEPIASASIGQVHLAKLLVDGIEKKVVIKVQHPHSRTLMMDDFWSLLVICKVVGWLEPEYAFMEILMREWAYEARKELDFTNELDHLQQAQLALQEMFSAKDSVMYTNTEKRTPFHAEVPTPFPEYSNRRVLVMEYCEGIRLDNFAKLKQWNLNRVDIVDGLSQTFAHFMYCSPIFNGDPHLGNFLISRGICGGEEGFILTLLDWGLAKKLSNEKRLAFCQMVYAAATLDYGLLLDSFKTIGLKMKREDAGQSMEDMRFFLRDMAPRTQARQTIKSKIKQGKALAKKNKEKVPMESKAYPGELFFFIPVTELLHGLGSKLRVTMKYLETIRPYAEMGLRRLAAETEPHFLTKTVMENINPKDTELQKQLEAVLNDLKNEGQFVGGQICVLNRNGSVEVDVVAGTFGGLKDHLPMQRNTLILGYSCTKAITATLAHIMVEEGYLSLDEPICERVWKDFCPTKSVPLELANSLGLSQEQTEQRWKWKRQITLRHILNHTSGLWSALPPKLTLKGMASCEACCAAFEYNSNEAEGTILPSRPPGEKSEYHFMSFGWLVAGTARGAYALKHGRASVTYEEVYNQILLPKLSDAVQELGFSPLGATGDWAFSLANTVTSDIRASAMIQKQREKALRGDEEDSDMSQSMAEVMKTFKGAEFLLDPRVWNSKDALSANVPAAGGRFSAAALARFYHELGNLKSFLKPEVLDQIFDASTVEASVSAMQGVTSLTNDSSNHRTKISLGFQLIQTERDSGDFFSGVGHAGVGGSIGFWHKPSGLAVGVMLNKADSGQEVALRILRIIGDHFKI